MRRLKLSLGLVLALCCTAAPPAASGAPIPAGNTGWTWANPLPQGHSLLHVAQAEGRVWAGGATGTLIWSDDGGGSWDAVRTGLLDDIRVVEPISRNSIVFGGSCALRRTDDAGASVKRLPWSASDDNCSAKILEVDFPTSTSGYLLLSNGDIQVTADGGQSWRKQGAAPTGGSVDPLGDMHFDAQGRGLLSVGGRILQSLDAGATWTPVMAAAAGGMHNFEFLSSDFGYAMADHGNLLVTTDGGYTWQDVATARAQATDAVTHAYSFSGLTCADGFTCLATRADGGGLLRTIDGGLHWSGVATGADQAVVLMGDKRSVAVGANGAVARSSDAGATWERVERRANGIFNGVRAESKSTALVFGDAGAVAISSDGGASWRSVNTPDTSSITDVSSHGARMVAVGTSGKLWASEDRGENWRSIAIGTKQRVRALMLFKGGRTLYVGPRGVRLSSRFARRSKAVRGEVSRLALSRVDAAGSAVFVHGARHLAVTTNRGRSFKRLRTPRGSGAIAELEMLSARRGFLLDSRAELFETRNGARTWKRIETTGANSATSLAFGSTKHGYIGDATGRVLATDDGGRTWARQYPFFDAKGDSDLLMAGTTRRGALALVRGSATIFRSTSGGRIGRSSKLTIKPSMTRVRRGTIVPVTGRLSPASGVERVAVLARVAKARGGTQWVTQNVTVSPTGNFTTRWRITQPTVFIARWSGDAARDGDAAPQKHVRLRK